MNLMEFVIAEFIILVPVLYVLGVILKISTVVKDKYIPILLTCLGILLSMLANGPSAESLVQGILVSGVAALGNQTVKQLKKEEW